MEFQLSFSGMTLTLETKKKYKKRKAQLFVNHHNNSISVVLGFSDQNLDLVQLTRDLIIEN